MRDAIYLIGFLIIYSVCLVLVLEQDEAKQVAKPFTTSVDTTAIEVTPTKEDSPKVIEAKKPVTHTDTAHVAQATHTDVVGDTIQVTITYYQPVTGQCSGNPLITADGSKIDLTKLERGEIKWCAVSPDLYRKGGKVWIHGMGVYEIHDRTSSKHRAWVDILISPKHKPSGTKKGHKAIIF